MPCPKTRSNSGIKSSGKVKGCQSPQRVCFFLSASKASPQEEISREPIREDQNQVVLSVVSGGASIRFSQHLGFSFNYG